MVNVPKWSLRIFSKSLKMLKFREFGSESNWIGSEHFVIELVSLEDLTWRIWRSDQFPKPLSSLSVSLFQATQPGFMLFMLGSFPHAFRTWIKVLMTSSTDILTWSSREFLHRLERCSLKWLIESYYPCLNVDLLLKSIVGHFLYEQINKI